MTSELVPFNLSDRGLLLGDGVFTTALVLEGQVVCLDAHRERLLHACKVLDIDVALPMLSEAFSLAASNMRLGSVRVTVTRGSGPRGLFPSGQFKPTILASNTEMGTAGMFSQLSLRPSSIRRNDTSPTSQLKTLAYLDAILAAKEAVNAGFNEPLMLNTQNRIACTGTGNLFVLRGRRLSTPPPSEGILPGIMRALLLRIAPTLGLSVAEEQLTLEDLTKADAVVVTNCLKLLATVTAIGESSLPPPPGMVAELAAALCKAIASGGAVDPRQVGARISYGS